MTREEIKMQAALRALECEKAYLESELSRVMMQTVNPDSRNYQKFDRYATDLQCRLLELKEKFEEI